MWHSHHFAQDPNSHMDSIPSSPSIEFLPCLRVDAFGHTFYIPDLEGSGHRDSLRTQALAAQGDRFSSFPRSRKLLRYAGPLGPRLFRDTALDVDGENSTHSEHTRFFIPSSFCGPLALP